MKFGLVVPEEFYLHYNQFKFEISGLLNWVRVMEGDVLMITGDLDAYDVLMVNVSSTEQEYMSVIRQANPGAKVVACFDYGFDVVGDYFTNLHRVRQLMARADVVFSVNRNQRAWMRLLMANAGVAKEVHYVPHPTDVENVRKFRVPREQRLGVAAVWHQYDQYHLQAYEVVRAAERFLKRPMQKALIGLKTSVMKGSGLRVTASAIPVIADDYPEAALRGKPLDPDLPQVVQMVPPGISWDVVFPYMGPDGWYSTISRFEAVLDLYTVNSIGRAGLDCAGVGVPMVGSRLQDSAVDLFPRTVVDPYEPMEPTRLLTKLLSDADFYGGVVATADAGLAKFGFEESRKRMMRLLETK